MKIGLVTPLPAGSHLVRIHTDAAAEYDRLTVAIEQDGGETLFMLGMVEPIPPRDVLLAARDREFPRARRVVFERRNGGRVRLVTIKLPPNGENPMSEHLIQRVACIIRKSDDSPLLHCPPIEVNGQRFETAYDVELALPIEVIEVARGAGLTVELVDSVGEELLPPEELPPLPEESELQPNINTASPALASEGNGDAAAAEGVGGQPDGSGGLVPPPANPFDADAVLVGSIKDVTARLGTLADWQLEAVRAAEADREVARKGVLEAVTKAAAALVA